MSKLRKLEQKGHLAVKKIHRIQKVHLHGFGGLGEIHHSDHQAFFAGSEMGASLSESARAFWNKNINPAISKVTENAKEKLIKKGSEIINKKLAEDPALRKKSQDTIAQTIKGAILENKWYIIGGIVGLATFFVVLNRATAKK